MSDKKINFNYLLSPLLFSLLLFLAFDASAQTSELEDFSRDEFIEKFEDVIHRSLDHQQTNEKLVRIYFLSRDALVTAVKSKNNIKKALQKIARDIRAGAYQLVESKTNLNTAEKEEYFSSAGFATLRHIKV